MKSLKLTLAIAATGLLLSSCGSSKNIENSINSQTTQVSNTLKRNEYSILDKDAIFTVENKKQFKKYTLEQLKQAALLAAERQAIESGADGVLNPRYIVDQKKKKFKVTVRAKSYRLKSDSEYIDMENKLKHNPTGN